MKVLHLHSGNFYGGVETTLLALQVYRNECPEMEPQFGLCFAGRLSRELRSAGARVHSLGEVRLRNPLRVWRARRRLKALIEQEQFDAVVCHMSWPSVVFGPVVRSRRLPLVFWMHDATGGTHWLERWAGRTPADLVICNSRFTARQAPGLFPKAPRRVLYCPVPSPDAGERSRGRAAVREMLRTSQSDLVVVQVGRMEAWKGHLAHLQALAKLADRGSWTCWMVGGPQKPAERAYFKRLCKTARELGIASRVRFTGQRNDVPDLLAAADIFCQPNTAPEPFGVVFIEALYAGLPVVTTALGGALEIVDAKSGLLTPPGDVLKLAAALRRLMEDSELRSGGDQRAARARQLCHPATQIRALQELLKGCTANQRRAA